MWRQIPLQYVAARSFVAGIRGSLGSITTATEQLRRAAHFSQTASSLRWFCMSTRPLLFLDGADSSGSNSPIPPPTIGKPSIYDEKLGFFFRTVRWVPHPDKTRTGGEDAFLSTDYVLGVADGVGWWNQLVEKESKVCPSSEAENLAGSSPTPSQQYSEAFMREAFEYCEMEYFGQGQVPVLDLVKHCYEECSSVEKGSSTALFASMRDAHYLDVYNLGDCKLLLIRNRKVYFRTEDQVHSLNYPYQLGAGSRDRPSDGIITSIPVRTGDLVILGSDGVFDNVFDETIVDIIYNLDQKVPDFNLLSMAKNDEAYYHILKEERKSASMRAKAGEHAQRLLQAASKEIIELAVSNSNDPRANTPFATKCIEGGAYHEGGKPDDMTLIMATVTSSFVAEGIRFGVYDSQESMPSPYKNWP